MKYVFYHHQLSDALLIDALHLLSLVISPTEHVDTFPVTLSCNGNENWAKGETLIHGLRKVGGRPFSIISFLEF